MIFLILTYVAAKGENGGGHVGDVFLFIQINGLEDIEVSAAVLLQGLLETVNEKNNWITPNYCDYNCFKWKGAIKIASNSSPSGYKNINRSSKVCPRPEIARKNRK